MVSAETSSLVNSLGPTVELSVFEFALIVTKALMKSPAADCILEFTLGSKNAINFEIKFCSFNNSIIPLGLSGLSVLMTLSRKSIKGGLSICLKNLSTMSS
ncbi:hypothetical protein WICMUC_004360 [Wickerhamomyces mucosus]|uniref:Uncharacterized protein n=1 Tax=Wickerhamomyces mucosus TaxID=1378264 RepID=A0A9P8PIS4_9ASCO|nr:hypothetical protein WICMUC_004360 [Wickerhamomyces mucosus]